MSDMMIEPMFSRPLGITKIEKLPHITDLENLEYRVAPWNKKSNTGDFSKDIQFLSSYPELERTITKEVQDFNNKVMCYTDNTVVLTKSWVTRFKPGIKGNLHNHKNCMYSAVLYMDDKGSSMTLADYNNHYMYDIYPKEYNQFSTKSYTITPEKGKLIIFPAFISHTVDPNISNSVRYSIVANYTIKGPIGFEDTSWEIK
jgi:uncharacterized protein (TIGR02466 family)